MKLLILHHHSRAGGVNRIIMSQVESLLRAAPDLGITLMTGELPGSSGMHLKNAKVELFEPLAYLDRSTASCGSCGALLDAIMSKLYHRALAPDTIIHVHNSSLGKNPVLTYALYLLARRGANIFCHCHDFAADGRPENMSFLKRVIEDFFAEKLDDVLYPDFPNVFFGVLNARDYAFLKSRLPETSRLFLLPNPVHFHKHLPGRAKRAEAKALFAYTTGADPLKKLVTYPVRGIRRKNIGEFIMLAALFGDTMNFQITLDPLNEAERENYLAWKDFALSNGINIYFETGRVMSFRDIMCASDFCVSTSVKEGFGMAFLEPWLFGVPVAGRRIAYVTDDFASCGLCFDLLYDRVSVPGEYALTDFPELSCDEQMKVIRKLRKNAAFKASFLSTNDFLSRLFNEIPAAVIDSNRKKIMMDYSIDSYGEKLYGIYKRMLEGVPGAFPAAG